MRDKRWAAGMALAAGLICALLGAGQSAFGALIAPFTLLGRGLRALSLASPLGNGLALTLYAALSLAPAACFFALRRKAKLPTDWLWLALSLYTFLLLYLMINPHLVYALFPQFLAGGDMLLLLQGILVVLFWALAIACALFRWTGRGDAKGVLAQLGALMGLAALVILFALPGALLAILSPWPGAALPGRAYLAATALMTAAPQVALAAMLASAMDLAAAMGRGWFEEDSIAPARRLAKRGMAALHTTLWAMVAHGAIGLALARQVSDLRLQADLPLGQMIGACAAVALARLVEDGCTIRRENQLMI